MLKRIAIGLVAVLVVCAGLGYWGLGQISRVTERHPGQYFDSAGVKIFYTDEGPREADPVILVHGFGANADLNWRAPGIVDMLDKEFRVITLDNRGHGLSDKPHEADQYGIEMVEDIVRLMDHLKIAKAHVVGYSMGSFITLRLIASHPDRLLSAMTCGAGWRKAEGADLEMLNGLADSLEKGGGFELLMKRIARIGTEPSWWKLQTVNYALGQLNDKMALAKLIRGFKSLQVTEEELRRNTVPVRAIAGSVDPLRDGVDAMKDVMAHLETIYIPNEDHLTTIRNKEFKKDILEFVAAHAVHRATVDTPAVNAKAAGEGTATLTPAAAN